MGTPFPTQETTIRQLANTDSPHAKKPPPLPENFPTDPALISPTLKPTTTIQSTDVGDELPATRQTSSRTPPPQQQSPHGKSITIPPRHHNDDSQSGHRFQPTTDDDMIFPVSHPTIKVTHVDRMHDLTGEHLTFSCTGQYAPKNAEWHFSVTRKALIELHTSFKLDEVSKLFRPKPQQDGTTHDDRQSMRLISEASSGHDGVIRGKVTFPKVLMPGAHYFASKEGGSSASLARACERYLSTIVQSPDLLNTPAVFEILRVSSMSFAWGLGPSVYEGWVRICIRSRTMADATWHSCRAGRCSCLCTCLPDSGPGLSKERLWMVMKRDNCVLFLTKPANKQPRHALLVDSGFDVRKSLSSVGSKNHIHICCSSFLADLKFDSSREKKNVSVALSHAFSQDGAWFSASNHPHASFAPESMCDDVRFHIDGHSYFEAVADAMEAAQIEVFIQGWWITPDLSLKRRAQQVGVSQRGEEDDELNEYWKLSAILRRCSDRGVRVYVLMYNEPTVALDLDSKFQQSRLAGIKNVFVLRHPIHRVTNKLSAWFWSHHEKLVVVDQTVAFVGGMDMAWGRYDTKEHVLATDARFPPGLDYCNPRLANITDPAKWWQDVIDRNHAPRLPWHDVMVELVGNQIVTDVARHFCLQWTAHVEDVRMKGKKVHLTCPFPRNEAYGTHEGNIDNGYRHSNRNHDDDHERQPSSNNYTEQQQRVSGGGMEEAADNGHDGLKSNPTAPKFTCRVQVVRSLPVWSGALPGNYEQSCQAAYIALISRSKRFVYIENQFFQSGLSKDPVLQNRIVEALCERIVKAYKENQLFKVYVLIPLLPAFEGSINTADTLRHVLFWQYRTICRGDRSLFHALENAGVNPSDFIVFLSLRTFDMLPAEVAVTTEMIYIHAKVLVVDDETCIVGSANINDRSMNGDRDSEVAIVIRDVLGNGLVKDFRTRLWMEHIGAFGSHGTVIAHPETNECFEAIKARAKLNTEIYEKVFQCLPSDRVQSFVDLKELPSGARNVQEEMKQESVDNSLSRIIKMQSFSITAKAAQAVGDEPAVDMADFTTAAQKLRGRCGAFAGSAGTSDVVRADLNKLTAVLGSVVEFPLDFLRQEASALKPLGGLLGDELYL